MKSVVLTGATSFIGVHLIQELLKKNYKIYAIVRPNSANLNRLPENDHIHVVELDMTQYDALPQYIEKADCFYHLAWEGARVPHRDNAQLQRKNYECAVMAMRAARRLSCRTFLGTGSQAEYGKMTGPVDESYPCAPVTEYGKEKLHAYESLQQMAKESGIKFIWARIFSLYGKYDYNRTLIMSCMERMKRNEPIPLTACTQLWDYLHVEDAARLLVLLAEHEKAEGIFNIASGNVRPLKSFVLEMKKVLNSSSELRFGAIPYATGGMVDLIPVIQKLKSIVRIAENYWDFQQGIYKLADTERN